MALRKLPLQIQSRLNASAQNKTYKSAVEELVYNAFDAEATSIAIRINIQENYIQVVDNGHGVSKEDFHLLGLRHSTSRYSNPTGSDLNQKYGRYGQSLANIIEVSESVQITSRFKNTEETWTKQFYKGKEQKCLATASRPSTGTTVEIKGFLYNLKIQKKAVKALEELQGIKTFLQQMSLVHLNTSISLRDNLDNEILFKIHKNRDIHQTLSSVLDIEKSNMQELQVEKNQYKVTGFIQKTGTESHGYQWIYMNKRTIENSNLHKIINQNLVKSVPVKKGLKKKGHNNEEENVMSNNKLPDYFIFIQCPLNDNNVISNPQQSMLELKNWTQIDKLVEKLVKFYTGDINTAKKAVDKLPKETVNQNKADTRNQVKQIMEKIMCSHPKKDGLHLHNGVKGKIVKRKTMKALVNTSQSQAKVKPLVDNSKVNDEIHEFSDLMELQNHEKLLDVDSKNKPASFKIPKKPQKNKGSANTDKHHKLSKNAQAQPEKMKHEVVVKDPVISKFEKETDEVQKRCHILANKVHNLLGIKKKRKCKIFTNEIIQYSNIISGNKSISIRKKIEEEIIHEYLPLPRKTKAPKRANCVSSIMKSDDLIKPVVPEVIQKNIAENKIHTDRPKPRMDHYVARDESSIDIPKLTYDSHNYCKDTQMHQPDENLTENNKRFQFISKTSRDNFASPTKRRKMINNNLKPSTKKQTVAKKSRDKKISNYMFKDLLQSSYSIHFTETADSKLHKTPNISPVVSDIIPIDEKAHIEDEEEDKTFIGYTYTEKDCDKATDSNWIIGTIPASPNLADILTFDDKTNIGSTYTIIDSDKAINIDWNNDTASKSPNILNTVSLDNKTQIESINTIIDVDTDIALNNNKNNDTAISPDPFDSVPLDSKENIERRNAKIYSDKALNNWHNDTTCDFIETYNIETSYANRCSYESANLDDSMNINRNKINFGRNEFNVIFISESQNRNAELNEQENIDPLRICETVLSCQDEDYNLIFDSCNNIVEENILNESQTVEESEALTNHKQRSNQRDLFKSGIQELLKQANPVDLDFELNPFKLINRRRFVPKGMSQIFENCNTRKDCNYEFDKDYFEETMYNNFVQDVHINSEIFEPRIQNVREIATRDIVRVSNKLSKDNACLTFDGNSLKQAEVLGQVDCKFIATKIQGKSDGHREYLVLFDQHAVHERIRLENNMLGYLQDDEWKSVALDGISLKLTRDEILYLHNYKDKFHKLGLKWNILNNTEISVTAIPEAVLGKNPRQEDVILKAVKSLIKEEINIIKEQGGCVSLYPKAIMDLVFSEACRYAIMFGDALTKSDCRTLLNALSGCKTPFQCAHGRPVMAVLTDIKTDKHTYKVNVTRVQQFQRRMQNVINNNKQ